MGVVLFTIDCPSCKILEKKLDVAGIGYAKCHDKNLMAEMGFDHLPVLKVDDETFLNYKDAVKWVNQRMGD